MDLLHLLENTFDRKHNPNLKAQECFRNEVIFRESVQIRRNINFTSVQWRI